MRFQRTHELRDLGNAESDCDELRLEEIVCARETGVSRGNVRNVKRVI